MNEGRVGLVVGKFCPLHRGHQWLLDTAQAGCDRLLVLSYTKPEFAGMPPARREHWLKSLYPRSDTWVLDDERLAALCQRAGIAVRRLPANDEADDVHRQFVAWFLRDVIRTSVDTVFTSEAYGPGFAEVLSRDQVARGGRPVTHVSVDRARVNVPVSGTALRAGSAAPHQYLAPVVHRDLVRRVVLLGGESTGKSTLSQWLAQALGSVYAAEYGRECWERNEGRLTEADLLHIAHTQIEREELLLAAARGWLVCDTSPLTTLLYAQAMFQWADPVLEQLAGRAYDLVLLCDPDVPFVQDGTRRDADFRQWQHEWYLRELRARRIEHVVLTGDWEQRRGTALEALHAACPSLTVAVPPAP